jgi:antitoxin VapB
MALSIHSPEAERLASEVASATGESISEAVINALRERLEREKRKAQNVEAVVRKATAIGKHFCSLPVLDPRSANEILGYNEHGLPS